MTGIGAHQSANMKNDEWLTPPELIKALGSFDLDPCAPINRPWDTAKKHYTIREDGLRQIWTGRVWLNPPYGQETKKWLARMVRQNNGIVLMFARTETKMFFDYVWSSAAALLFIKGRLYFHYVDGTRASANSGGPSVLIAYGMENIDRLKRCGIPGKFLIN